jgi:outer membrane protein OmpA-like peptidoglycan-associated protein
LPPVSSPAPPPVAPPAAPPSQLVFGPPPSDIAILQERTAGPARAAPGGTFPTDSSLPSWSARQSPALGPAIPPAPDPATLDPASQVAIVTFGQGSSKLSGTARRIIREVAEMQRQRGGKLYVIGHSSSWTRDMNPVRHNMINFGLSLDRANTVAQELMRIGLTAGDFSIGAMSDGRPLFFEITPSGEAGNRRVEIFLDGG